MRKCLCAAVMVALLAGSSMAVTKSVYFRGTTGDRVSWNQLANWQEFNAGWINATALPDNDDNVWIGYFQNDPGMVIGNGVTGYAGVLYGSGGTTQAKNYDLTIQNGGKLEVRSVFSINTHRNNSPVGIVTVQTGGELTLTDGTALLIVASGGGGTGTEVGTGTLVVDGGTVNARTLRGTDNKTTAAGHVQLNAGTINLYGNASNGYLILDGWGTNGGTMDITGGVLKMFGAESNFSFINHYVNGSGSLTGYGSAANVRWEYDSELVNPTNPAAKGAMVVWAVPEPATLILLGLGGGLMTLVRKRG